MNDDSRDMNAPARRDELEGEGAIRGTARMEAFADGVLCRIYHDRSAGTWFMEGVLD